MAENKEKHLRRLISLLDDPDEESALMVLSELLSREDEIDLELLAEYQESSSKCMRRRIHQLQSALIQPTPHLKALKVLPQYNALQPQGHRP